MLIINENNDINILENIHVPTEPDYFWVLDLQLLDFILAPVLILEELLCPSIAIEVGGSTFSVPAKWNILVMDDDTSQLDIVEIYKLAGNPFNAMVYDTEKHTAHGSRVRVMDYAVERHNVNPSLNRHHMLCHPIGPVHWVCLAPNDSYNKYLKNLVIGDIL